jgi:hypothetical protein
MPPEYSSTPHETPDPLPPPPALGRCPVCGAPRPFDPIASVILDALEHITTTLADVRRHVEEVTL